MTVFSLGLQTALELQPYTSLKYTYILFFLTFT